jgi:N-acetylmuramoyl-L-alanine amidase
MKYLKSSHLFKIMLLLLAISLCLPIAGLAAKAKSKSSKNHAVVSYSRVKNVKVWTGPETTQVAVYFQGRAQYDVSPLAGKTGFILRAANASPEEGSQVIEVNDGVISKVEVEAASGGTEITVHFVEPTDFKVSSEQKDRNFPVIEVTRPVNKQPAHLNTQQINELKKNNKIVVIDPGHGGWHYGACANGLLEKNETMRLALQLRDKLNSIPGIKAFLTRNENFNQGDYYVSLQRRRDIAAELGADLFVSLHLNSPGSLSDRASHGTEIYYLAYGDASDAEASRLADLENAADLDPEEVHRSNDVVSELLLDERLIALNNQSSLLAGLVLNNVLQLNGLTDRGVKNAQFAVLKCKMPSVLLELCFVTNPNESNLLQEPGFYNEVSNKMASAVGKYFTINPGRTNNVVANSKGKESNDSGTAEDVLSDLMKSNSSQGSNAGHKQPMISPK